MKKSQVEIKVLALNTINEHAAKFYEYEKAHFSQFLGKGIFKVNGDLKAKYEHEKLTFSGQFADGTHYHSHYWFTNRLGYFCLNVKTCVNGGSWDVRPTTAFCVYEEMSVDLFEAKDGLLVVATRAPQDFNVRYSVSEILASVEKVKEAAHQYNMVLESVPYEFRNMFNLNRA